MNLEFVFKIIDKTEWQKAKQKGTYGGSTKDIEDGYIHFSEEDQVSETLKKYYPNKENLVLLKVNAFNLEHLLWEQASNGDMYPHLYAPLDIKNVENEFELLLNEDGSHELPEIIKKYQFNLPK
tara:strand:- start:1546 stop:1917 length:372 start_codon:yes stop_codon:yes gene_type:complete